MNEELRWAYAAGLVDGEGCISISRHSYSAKKRPGLSRYTVSIAVAMNDPESVAEIADLWGKAPRIGRATINGGRGKKYQVAPHCVELNSVAAVERVLLRMLPYLKAKKEQAQVVLDACVYLQAYLHKHQVPDEVRAQWEQQYQRCRALKVRNASVVVLAA